VTVVGSCKGSHRLLLQVSSRSSSSACASEQWDGCDNGADGCQQQQQQQQGVLSPVHYVQVLVTVAEPCVVLDTYR
jgi:hypothetical protein